MTGTRGSGNGGGGDGRPPDDDRWKLLDDAVASKASALGVSAVFRDSIIRRAFVSTAPRGEVIVPASATPNFFSLVARGAVAVVVHDDRGRRSIVQIAKPGFIFSLTPFLHHAERRRFTAVAYDDAVVATVDREVVRDVLRAVGPDAHLGLLMYMCRALSRLVYDRCRLFRIEIADRILQQLIDLARHFGHPGDPGLIDLPLLQQDLADLAGTTRAGAAHALAALGRQVVSRENGHYRIAPTVLARRVIPTSLVAAAAATPAREIELRDALRAVLDVAWHSLGRPAAAINLFTERASLFRYAAGDVMSVGPSPAVTFLVQGSARIECVIPGADPVGVRIAGPGQFIGVGWSVNGLDRQRQFRAVAQTDVVVARLEVHDMKEVVRAFSGDQLLQLIALYSNLLSRQIYDRCVMLPMRVKRRVPYVLRALADELGTPHRLGTLIDQPLHEEDIGVLVGANREAVCRYGIVPMKRGGKLSVVGGRILLHGYRPAPRSDRSS